MNEGVPRDQNHKILISLQLALLPLQSHHRHIGETKLEPGKLRTILDPDDSWYLDKVRGEARYAIILLNFEAWRPPGLVAVRLRADHEATPTKVGIRS